MVCEKEAAHDIENEATGIATVRPLAPTWRDRVYSCDYAYDGGAVLRISVKDLPNLDATASYFERLGRRLGRVRDAELTIAARYSYVTRSGAVIARKDTQVLLVDPSGLPRRFGKPAVFRGAIALGAAHAILDCWQ
jgi:hypothetical protein